MTYTYTLRHEDEWFNTPHIQQQFSLSRKMSLNSQHERYKDFLWLHIKQTVLYSESRKTDECSVITVSGCKFLNQ